ncbi:MAG TPA: TlpA disulfide reductase family protein [Longimicrobiales bacterium]
MVTRRIRRRLVVAAAFAVAAAPGALRAQDVGLPLGATPEPVVIEDLDGNPVDLAEVIGKRPALVEFWATWCPLCEALEPRIEAAHRRFGDDVAFLIVAVGVNQSPRRIRRHLESHPMPGRVLWDGQGRATRAFMAPTTSYVVVLDAAGRVVYTGTGEEQDIEAAVAKAAASGSHGAGDARRR